MTNMTISKLTYHYIVPGLLMKDLVNVVRGSLVRLRKKIMFGLELVAFVANNSPMWPNVMSHRNVTQIEKSRLLFNTI